MNKSVKLKNQIIKNDTDKLLFISGPCLLESEKLVRLVAKNLINYPKKNNFNTKITNYKTNLNIYCLIYSNWIPWLSAITNRFPLPNQKSSAYLHGTHARLA